MSPRAGSPEINVTPLIDVLLVLLIIFLVMMPIMMRTEIVALPPNERDVAPTEVPIALKLNGDLTIAIDEGSAIPLGELAGALRPRLRLTKGIFVDAEDGVPWQEVVALVDALRGLAGGQNAIEVAVRIRESPGP